MIRRDPSTIKLTEEDIKEWKVTKNKILMARKEAAEKDSSSVASEHLISDHKLKYQAELNARRERIGLN